MAFINWGSESDKQKKYRQFLEEEALLEQAINASQGRSGQAPGVGGGSLLYKTVTGDSTKQSTLVIFREYNQPTYRYYVANYSTGNIAGPFDTGVSVEDYSLNDLYSYPLQYSGYGLRFYRGDINEHTMLFLDYEGMVVETVVAISTDVTMDVYHGKYIIATDYDEQLLWVFDGTSVLTDNTVFQGADGFNLGMNGEYSSTNTGFGLTVYMPDTSKKFYLCNSNTITQVYETTPANELLQFVEFYAFYNSDKFVAVTRNTSNGRTNKVEVVSSTGVIQNAINIDTDYLIDSNFQIYGSNKFFIHFYNNSDTSIDHTVFSYDGSNNTIESTFINAETYTSWRSDYRTRSFGSDYDYPIVENAFLWFYGNSFNTNGLTYFDNAVVVRLFEGQVPSVYNYADGSTKGIYFSDEGLNRNFALYVTDNNDDTELQAMVIKASGEPVFSDLGYSATDLDDIDVTEIGERVAVVIEYELGGGETNTIVQSFNSSGTKATPKLELGTENHSSYNGYGAYIITGDNVANFLTPSGSWVQYPELEDFDTALFHTNSNQTTAPYYANWANARVEYTHTQLNDDPDGGVAPEDFIMDGSIVSGAQYFGAGSTYFTNLYPGLFVLVAKSVNLSGFTIDGNIGADGNGQVETEIVPVLGYSKPYTAYVKKVYDAGDPSINQIIIIDTDGTGVNRTVDLDSDFDTHSITGINSATEIHYLLFAKTPDGNGYVTPEEIESVITEYLDLVEGQNLTNTLAALNSNYSNITGIFPAYDSVDTDRIYYFSDRGNNEIQDGGDDMYDNANIITTSLSGGVLFRVFKSNGEVKQFNVPVFEERWFGRNGMFFTTVDINGDFVITNYDLNGNVIATSNTGHPDYDYGDYIEDRGEFISVEKYFDPELGEILNNYRFHAISSKGIQHVEVISLDGGPNYRIISNDWGEWAD